MKRIILLFIAMVGVLCIHAEDYPYLTFETTDRQKVSVEVSSLTLTVSGNTLNIGSQSFTLSNLSKMYFSLSNETITGIEEITSSALDEAAEIYDLQGHRIPKEQMRKGIYIIKSKNRTYKMIVR